MDQNGRSVIRRPSSGGRDELSTADPFRERAVALMRRIEKSMTARVGTDHQNEK